MANRNNLLKWESCYKEKGAVTASMAPNIIGEFYIRFSAAKALKNKPPFVTTMEYWVAGGRCLIFDLGDHKTLKAAQEICTNLISDIGGFYVKHVKKLKKGRKNEVDRIKSESAAYVTL